MESSTIIVDDRDPRIDWKPANGWVESGNTTFEYNGTTHGSVTPGSCMTFDFSGSSIEVLGTNGRATLGVQPCAVFSVGNTTSTYTPVSNTGPAPLYKQTLFSSGPLPTANYTLSMKVVIDGQACGQNVHKSSLGPLWVDFLQYVPNSQNSSSQSSPKTTGVTSSHLRSSDSSGTTIALSASFGATAVSLNSLGTTVPYQSSVSPTSTSTSSTITMTYVQSTASSSAPGDRGSTTQALSSSSERGKIAGGVIGGLMLLSSICFAAIWLIRKRKRAKMAPSQIFALDFLRKEKWTSHFQFDHTRRSLRKGPASEKTNAGRNTGSRTGSLDGHSEVRHIDGDDGWMEQLPSYTS